MKIILAFLFIIFASSAFAERIETGNPKMLKGWADSFLSNATTRKLTSLDGKCELTIAKITESKKKFGYKMELKFGATHLETAVVFLGSIDPYLDNVDVTIHDVAYDPISPVTFKLTNLAIIGSMGVGETLTQEEDYLAVRINEQNEVVSATGKNHWNSSPVCNF